MKLVPSDKFTLTTKLGVEDVHARLSEVINQNKRTIKQDIDNWPKVHFVGQLTENKL